MPLFQCKTTAKAFEKRTGKKGNLSNPVREIKQFESDLKSGEIEPGSKKKGRPSNG
jgi:hypothetical protein